MAKRKGTLNRTKVPKTSAMVKTCLQAFNLHMENLYKILEAETGEKAGQVSLKNKLDAGKQVKEIVMVVCQEELKAGSDLLMSEKGEANIYRETLSPEEMAKVKAMEEAVEEKHPEVKDEVEEGKVETKGNVVGIMGRFSEEA